jgi:hypothetical protein
MIKMTDLNDFDPYKNTPSFTTTATSGTFTIGNINIPPSNVLGTPYKPYTPIKVEIEKHKIVPPMEAKDWTEIVFIIDKSGSMGNLIGDTIGGFNAFLEQQRALGDNARVTTVLFDNEISYLHSYKNIKHVNKMTREDYKPYGSTSLLDAIGIAIKNTNANIDEYEDKDVPSHIVFVVITDGEENTSSKFTKDKIKNMVRHQQRFHDWKFFFLGANIDSFAEAGSLGFSSTYTSNYTANSGGVDSAYWAVSQAVNNIRTSCVVDDSWKKDIK